MSQPLGFQGQYLDPTLGLYDLRARDYDPSIGAFTAKDPIAVPVGDAYYSSYSYGRHNPMLFHDVTGTEPRVWDDGRVVGVPMAGGLTASTAVSMNTAAESVSTTRTGASNSGKTPRSYTKRPSALPTVGSCTTAAECQAVACGYDSLHDSSLLGDASGVSPSVVNTPSDSRPVDWGTGVAGIINLTIGAGKILAGVGFIVAGVPLAFTVVGIPVTIAAEIVGGYQIATGIARIVRGGEQVAVGFFIDKCQQNCDTTSNISRLGIGSVVPGGGLIERTSWYQENVASTPERDSDWIDFLGSIW